MRFTFPMFIVFAELVWLLSVPVVLRELGLFSLIWVEIVFEPCAVGLFGSLFRVVRSLLWSGAQWPKLPHERHVDFHFNCARSDGLSVFLLRE